MNLKSAVRALSASVVLTAATVTVPAALNELAGFVGSPVTFGGTAVAQQQKKNEEETRVTPAMSEAMFKRFGKVQELGSPQEEGAEPQLEEALEELNDIREDCREDCNKYELATMYNYYGWLYYALERPQDSIEAYENLLAQSPEIPLGLELGTMFKIAQLNYAEENYQEALKWLNDWMDVAENISAEAYVMRSQISYQLGNNNEALKDVNTAISLVQEKGKVPPEGWWNLQRALYLDKEDYNKGIEILEQMIVHYPKVPYYRQLAQLFGAVGRDSDQMYVLDALYVSGLLENKTDVKNLALLILGEQVPYKAAKILKKGIDEDLIEADSRNLEILANALRLAQEIEESIPVMARAAAKAETGDLFAQLAGIYLDADQHDKAVNAASRALEKGDIQRPGYLWLAKGTAHFNLEEYDQAIKAFREASKIDESNVKDAAGRWLQHVQAEKKRSDDLKGSQEESETPETPEIPTADV